MSNVIESLPEGMRALFLEIIGRADVGLLSALEDDDEPTQAQRATVEDILSKEFANSLRADYEPTARGKVIDDLLGAFLLRWPIGDG